MSNETKLDIISESQNRSPKLASPLDRDAVEMVLGRSNFPKVEPDIHLKHDKDNRRDPHVNNKEKDSVLASQPLLEPELEKQKPPLAGPEVDDLDEVPPASAPFPGIDDGLFERTPEKKPERDGDASDDSKEPPSTFNGADDGKWPWPPGVDAPDYPYDGEHGFAERPISPMMPPGVAVGVGLIMNSRYDVKDHKDICKADKINNMTVLGVFLVTIVNVFITSFSVATSTTVTVNGG